MLGRVTVRDTAGHTAFPDPGSVDYGNNAFVQAVQKYVDEAAGATNTIPAGVSLSNSSTPTAVYTEQIPGGYLSTNGRVKRRLVGTLSTDAATPGTLTVAISYGVASMTLLNAVPLNGGASNEPFELLIDLVAKNATNAQAVMAKFMQDAAFPSMARAAVAVDSTVNQNLVVTVTLSVANANNIFTLDAGG